MNVTNHIVADTTFTWSVEINADHTEAAVFTSGLTEVFV